MGQRGTLLTRINDQRIVLAGEPMLDADEGVLIISFEDGTSRVFNWDYIADYYYLTEGEYERLMEEDDDD